MIIKGFPNAVQIESTTESSTAETSLPFKSYIDDVNENLMCNFNSERSASQNVISINQINENTRKYLFLHLI